MNRLWIQTLSKIGLYSMKSQIQQTSIEKLNLQAKPTFIEFARSTTFFNKLGAKEVKKSVTTVSNAGRKRGRGKAVGKKSFPKMNKGFQPGVGKSNIRWPGLNSPIIQGQDVLRVEKLPPNPNFEKNLIEARKTIFRARAPSLHPLERGWSGRSLLGKYLGPPAGIDDEEFDSCMLEMKKLKLTHSKMGKIRSISVFVVVGNRKGVIGISSAKAKDLQNALKRAQMKAVRKLFTVHLEEQHTINHDFFYQFGITKLFAYKKPQGYGLVCHRGIMTCCDLLGIKDLYAKVERSRNKQRVIKAFLLGLLEQKSYQQLADERKLHLVEQRRETFRFPKVLASPAEVKSHNDSTLLFTEYVMGGKLPLRKQKKSNSVVLPHYAKYLKKVNNSRNHDMVRLRLRAELGDIRSYLSDIYPECDPSNARVSKQASADSSEP